MPHAAVTLTPGVNTNETPTLNQAGISSCNLVRFMYDPKLGGLIQKLGGWTRFFPNTMYATVRALWAWEDTNANKHLAVGTQNAPVTFQAQLSVITDGTQDDITPRSATDNVAVDFTTAAGDSAVTIVDATEGGITSYDVVYIPTHVSIGGVILFGLYQCTLNGATSYIINAMDIYGNPLLIPNTETNAGTVAEYTTTNASAVVTVTLADHGYVIGNTYPVLVQTSVGGVILYGNYTVQSIVDVDNFTIQAPNSATSGDTQSINGGNVRFIYSFGIGAIPPGTGYGIGAYGSGGYGTGTAVIPDTGRPISANDWTLDNWGDVLIACPISPEDILVTTAASGDGTTGTLTFSGTTYDIEVGEGFVVSDVVPLSWNGTYVATSSTDNSVSFLTAEMSAQTSAGTITVNDTPFAPVYQWDAVTGNPTATIIPQAPPVNDGIFLAMPQRQIIAWGSTFTGIQDPLLLRWCDVNNYNSWIGTVTNQAGSYRIPRGSRIVSCIQGPQQCLVWTDLGVWAMQYVGPQFVYSFNEIGFGCGLIARKAAASLNGIVYWMGASQFFLLSGDGVSPIPCPIWDVIFQDIDTSNLNKIRIAVNTRFNEIAWYYPSLSGGGEIDSYVKFNVVLNQWDYGSLGRTAWIDQSVLGPPIGSDPNLYLYQHETSTDADAAAMISNFTSGYFAMSEADVKIFVDQVWPDMKWGYYGSTQNATVNLTFNVLDYAGGMPTTYGPYALTQSTTFITPRFRGRLTSVTLGSSDVGSFWRIGQMRYRYSPDGKF